MDARERPRRGSNARALLAILALAVGGCATTFYGSPFIEGGRARCEQVCAAWQMELAGMVQMGEYSNGCICQVPGKVISSQAAAATGRPSPGPGPTRIVGDKSAGEKKKSAGEKKSAGDERRRALSWRTVGAASAQVTIDRAPSAAAAQRPRAPGPRVMPGRRRSRGVGGEKRDRRTFMGAELGLLRDE